jgi:DNA ligase 1
MIKPMLATDLVNFDDLRLPVLASPKLDGIRALITDGVVMSRKLIPIPNKHVQKLFGARTLEGLDGELIVGNPTNKTAYNDTMKGVMTIEGAPDVKFHVFDHFHHASRNYSYRYDIVKNLVAKLKHPAIKLVEHKYVESLKDLKKLEAALVELGYEGLMTRDLGGVYKFGRSTAKQQWLVKVKRWEDSDAVIIGYTEAETNVNAAERDALGHKKRSSKQAGKIKNGSLGSLLVKDLATKVEFPIGMFEGLTAGDRRKLFDMGHGLIGKLIKYKHLPHGAKNVPRSAVFMSFRHPIDL